MGISCFSLDYLTHMFHKTAPQLGISHDLEIKERAHRLWPFVRSMLDAIDYAESHYALEGHALLPSHAAEFRDKFGSDKVSICFLGYPDCLPHVKKDNVKSFASAANNWLQAKPDEYILKIVAAEVEYSRYLRDECKKYDLKFFDTSHDHWGTIHTAFDYLLNVKAEPVAIPTPSVI